MFGVVVRACRLRPARMSASMMICVVLSFAQNCFGAASWTNTGSGFWKDGSNWSGGRSPNSDLGSTLITNASTKTVTIDALTPSTNLTINSLTISGPGASTNTLLLADVGTNNPLTLVSSELKIAQGGALIVTNSSLVLTGSSSQGLNLFAGSATLESGSLRVLENPGATDITVLVRVGRTNAASLTIDGGVMEAGTVRVAEPFAQFSSQGTIRITGGLLSLSAELSIGKGSLGTGLVEVLGGRLQIADNQTNITRVGDAGVGRMVVSNATVSLGNMSVARHDGALGTLIVQTNGFLQFTDDLSIGRFSGATGAVVVADGQLDVVDHPIWVGREGAGQLVVSNGLVQALTLNVAAVATNTVSGTVSLMGGSTFLSSNVVVGNVSNTLAQLSVAGGDVTVTNSSASAVFDLVSGTVTLSGGTMTVDDLRVVRSAGRLILNSGTLRTKGSVVSNGLPLVVGEGGSPATLELLGGTHTFADGLVISSNATLTGCGTILGNLTNYGTIATNCGAVAPSITTDPQTVTVTVGGTATFTVVATGEPPPNYQWIHDNVALTNTNGSTLTLTNVQAADAGAYWVIASNSVDSVPSSHALLRVLVPPVMTSVGQSAGSLIFGFTGEDALNYFIEYKNKLDDPNWTLLRTETGNGAVIPIADTIGPETTRFYRIRVE